MKQNYSITIIFSLLLAAVLAACGDGEANLNPVEQEQIENVVKEYVVRNENVPEYEVSIEEVEDGWARVSLKPAAVDGPPTIMYLYDRPVDEATAAETDVQAGNDARVETTSGWTIALGPQAEFSTETLVEAGVPASLR